VLPFPIVDALSNRGTFSREGLTEIINVSVRLSSINTHTIPVYATAFERETKKVHYFSLNQLDEKNKLNALLASSALPFIYDSVLINGTAYWDGGLIDNTPISPLYDIGCQTIIVVHLNRTTLIDKSKYPGTKIIEIFPRNSVGEFFDGTLDFSPSNAIKRMRQGYEDAMAILDPIFNMIQTQGRFLNKISEVFHEENTSRNKLKQVFSEKRRLKSELEEVLDNYE